MRRWNWTDRLSVPAALIVAEATWTTLITDAALTHLRIHLGYLAIVLPALASLAVTTALIQTRRSRFGRAVAGTVALLVLVSVSAGLIGIGIAHVSLATLTWAPWRVAGTDQVASTVVAWAVALATCLRGFSLALRPVTFAHAARSGATGVTSLALLFVIEMVDPEAGLHHTTRSILWLAGLFLAGSITALVAARRSELEREVARGHRQGGSARNVAPIALVVGVTLATVLVAAGFAVVAPEIGAGLAVVGRAIVAFFVWLWDLIPWGNHHSPPKFYRGSGGPGCSPCRPRGAPPPKAADRQSAVAVLIAIVAIGLVIVIIAAIRARTSGRAPSRAADEESPRDTDSVFSWRHVLTQLLDWLRGLISRRRNTPISSEASSELSSEEESVRGQYRRLLEAAARADTARRVGETAGEFELRLAPLLEGATPAERCLEQTTRAYELVRYAAHDQSEFLAPVRDQVDLVVRTLNASACATAPEAGEASSPPRRSTGT